MSSPRKFAEKIALLQQKQAEGDAAFNTILYEVEAAKNVRQSDDEKQKKNKLFLIEKWSRINDKKQIRCANTKI